jgi:excinuclease ABC subunit A
MQEIIIKGARTHNLKNLDITLPREQLIVITGPSGSGKSSLAFDTLYAEGQRRYVESLSAYARQFLSMMEKPDVDHIEGLSPAISIEQKSTSHNPRSTVGTVTEIYDYLRLLFARAGRPECPKHGDTLSAQTISEMVDQALALPKDSKIMLLAPVVQNRKGEHVQLLGELKQQGFIRARINGEVCELDNAPKLNLRQKHTIEIVVDRFKVRDDMQQRLAESFETALALTDGIARIAYIDEDKPELLFSSKYACPHCGYSVAEIEPRLFSFNNPVGACPTCEGLGIESYFDENKVIADTALSLSQGAIRGWDKRHSYYHQLLICLAKHYKFSVDEPFESIPEEIQDIILYGSEEEDVVFEYMNDDGRKFRRKHPFEGIMNNMERRYEETTSEYIRTELAKYLNMQDCSACEGSRLCEAARFVFMDGKNLSAITKLPIDETVKFFKKLKLPGARGKIAEKILLEIIARLTFLENVGLEYLTLDRSAETLSGGEAQRIRLASQIGSGLVGVMYVLDEPTIGLHQRDNTRLLKTLKDLKKLGNTVIVVEHDEDTMRAADCILDIGPGAGVHGGEVVAFGTPQEITDNKGSLTGDYLSGRKSIAIPKQRTPYDKKRTLTLSGAAGHNLQKVDFTIPLGLMTCVTGVSGSGKSTLVNETLYPLAATHLNRATTLSVEPYKEIKGLGQLDKVVDIDQSPIGRTPRSNPATYTGLFTLIRDLFAGTQEARSRGYKVGRFSFNVKGGRCEACQGDGVLRVEMHFLPDIYVPCDVCKGNRYNRETLEIKYKGKSILDVLNMTVEEALVFFDAVPTITRKLVTLEQVGLSYITLGQNATTLSGGEAQRVKLAKELSKRDTGNTLYILDEPTTGLHFNDVAMLLKVLQTLRDHGNTVVVIEHNLDIIKTADWIVDLGPEGGYKGGKIIAEGTPEEVAKTKGSFTGEFLAKML